MENKKVILTIEQVETWKRVYGIIDARYGGLVLGNRHSKGSIVSGVKIINPIDQNTFSICEMEGGEFLMCAKATAKFKKRLVEINKYAGEYDEISKERINKLHNVIVPKTNMEMLVLSGYEHCIIRRSATSKYLEELDKMNKECII